MLYILWKPRTDRSKVRRFFGRPQPTRWLFCSRAAFVSGGTSPSGIVGHPTVMATREVKRHRQIAAPAILSQHWHWETGSHWNSELSEREWGFSVELREGKMPLTHIRRGDVVFTVDAATPMHVAITSAQVFGKSPGRLRSVHVAIAAGGGYDIFESVGGGVRKQPLKHGDYAIYCYRGPKQAEVREFAAQVAESFVALRTIDPTYGDYNKFRGALSPLRSSSTKHNVIDHHTQQFGAGAKAHRSFFCSNFVFRCFAAAAELSGLQTIPIPDSRAQISPRDLEGLLISSPHWHARNNGHVMSHP